MSDDMNKKPAQADSADIQADPQATTVDKARELQALQQRRRVLKAAALAAPLLITLRARSAYAQGTGSGTLGTYPGDYNNDGNINP